MSRLRIFHETIYDFEAPTGFGVWRLMLRPVDSHATRLVDASMELSPPGETHWAYDAYGNSVCRFTPAGQAQRLRIVSHLLADRFPAPLALFDPGSLTPITYDARDRIVLEPFMRPEIRSDDQAFHQWADAQAPFFGEPALGFAQRLSRQIASFTYAAREAEGTQSPSDTVLNGGACRDLALLMIETLRRFGFAARFVSGYLYDPAGAARGAGATHAWCDVFFPELGWIEFDPTNGIAESRDLIRVAATRTPEEAAPVSGSTLTPMGSHMSVRVEVSLASA